MSSTWTALALSARIALAATALAALVAIPLAYLLARRRFPGRSLLEALITLPLVLPPTVVGYAILVGLGARSAIGKWLRGRFDYSILFTEEGAALAAAIVALPLIYLPARAAFASVEREMEDIARLNGARAWQVFWHVSLPFARRGIASGLLLAFARAIGEFGATVMVLGWSDQKSTLSMVVYMAWEQGQPAAATGAVLLLVSLSLFLIGLYNLSSMGRRD